MLKKLIVRFILLLLLAIIIFFFGWINWRVKPGYYALYVSKTSGVRNTVIRPGEFVWNFEALLPTNIVLFQFKPVAYHNTYELSGFLPSANAYKAFISGNPDFSWKITVGINYTLRYEYIPVLYNSQGICTSDQLLEILQQKSQDIQQKIQEHIFLLNNSDFQDFLNGSAASAVSANLTKDFPELLFLNVTINFIQLPDFSSYQIAQKLYTKFLEQFQKALEPAMLESASKAVKEQTEIEQLKKYGELFKQYPELIQYLAIRAGITLQKP